MVSIDRCRELLRKGPETSDTDLESSRDQLYLLADLVIDLLPGSTKSSSLSEGSDQNPQNFGDFLDALPIADQESIEERAAIRQFDGGLDRGDAERAAMVDYIKKRSH